MHDKIIPLVAMLGLCGPGLAQIHQCTSSDGAVSFQDTPCSELEQSKLRVIRTDSQPGLRAAEKAWLKRLKRRPESKKPSPRRPQKSTKRQEKSCLKKKQQLEAVRARLRRGYKASQGESLRRKRKNYEAYLFRYCD